jgi:hypothetical protein
MITAPSLPNPLICDSCNTIIHLIINSIAEGLSKAAITALVDSACQNLPPPFDVTVSVAFDVSMDLIIRDNSFDICGQIGLCNPSSSIRKRTISKVQKFSGTRKLIKQAPTDIFCDICLEIVDYLTELIINETIEPALEELVSEFCDLFPWPVSSFCQDIADQYLDEIIADIEAGIEDICGAIGLCDTSVGPKRVGWLKVQQVKGSRPKVEKIKKGISH